MIARRTFLRMGALAGAALVLGGAGALAGCTPDADVLRVGTKIDVPGFGFQNPETGNIEGMEVDIARELAKRIKGDPNALQVTGVNVTTRGAMLDNGTLDATLATFTITEERKKSYNFSRPYYTDHIGVLVKKSSGIADLAGLDGQAEMLQELFPDAKNVGLLYCSGEPNSAYQINTIKPILEGMGYTCTEYAFTDSNDVASVAQNAASASDVIYIPTDNTAASCTEAIANVVLPAKVPVVAGEQGICSGCGVATLSIDYYELGQITGEMAYDILVNGSNPGDMEVQPAPNFTKMYNAANCEALGITVPDGYTAIEG